MAGDPKAPHKRKVYEIPPGTLESKCRSCHAVIFWIQPRPGVRLPVNPDGVSHFETCPDAASWSHGGKKGKMPATTEVMDVRSCARCGGDHGTLTFYRLARPAKDFEWWTLCPVTSEPILMRTRGKPDKVFTYAQ
jgi:hypothetical protein